MQQNNNFHEELRALVEKTTGRKMATPKDFDYLEDKVYERVHERLSKFTLMRFWGYVDRGGVSTTTLNILSKYVGYSDWDSFCQKNEEGKDESGFYVGNQITNKELNAGDILQINWKPNRCIKAKFEGMDLFTVVESENSKLMVGTTFHCTLIIEDQPLLLTCVVQNGQAPRNYTCGQRNGVRFFLLKK